MRERVARSLCWLVWSRGVVQLLSMCSTLLVARLLMPADYGLMALVSVWTYAVALMAEMGLSGAIVQFPELGDRELNACFWLILGASTVGYLVLCAAAGSIAAWFASPMLARVLPVAGLSLPLLALRTVPDGLLRKRLELDRVSQAEVAAMLVTMPVVLSIAWSGGGVWALVAGTLVTPLVQDVVSFWFVRWRPGLRMGSRRLGEILRYSLATLGARVGCVVYQQVDAVVLGKVSGQAVLGFYSMAKLLASLPLDKITVVANQLALPIMAGYQSDRATMRMSFLRGLRLVASLTVPLSIGLALVADDFVMVALGDKWASAVPVLRVLTVLGLIRSVDTLLPPVLLARYRASALFGWTLALLFVMPFAFWLGAAWLGSLGVALAWVVVYPLVMMWMAREALRELDMGWRTLLEQLRPIVVASLAMAVVVVIVRWGLPASDLSGRLVRLASSVTAGMIAYAMAVLGQGGALVREIREVTGWLVRPSLASRGASLGERT
jgi:O-antigen/teichoic acid export membrane protein